MLFTLKSSFYDNIIKLKIKRTFSGPRSFFSFWSWLNTICYKYQYTMLFLVSYSNDYNNNNLLIFHYKLTIHKVRCSWRVPL